MFIVTYGFFYRCFSCHHHKTNKTHLQIHTIPLLSYMSLSDIIVDIKDYLTIVGKWTGAFSMSLDPEFHEISIPLIECVDGIAGHVNAIKSTLARFDTDLSTVTDLTDRTALAHTLVDICATGKKDMSVLNRLVYKTAVVAQQSHDRLPRVLRQYTGDQYARRMQEYQDAIASLEYIEINATMITVLLVNIGIKAFGMLVYVLSVPTDSGSQEKIKACMTELTNALNGTVVMFTENSEQIECVYTKISETVECIKKHIELQEYTDAQGGLQALVPILRTVATVNDPVSVVTEDIGAVTMD